MRPPGAARSGQKDAEKDARTAEEDASVAAEEDARTSWGRGGFVIWLVALSVHHFAVSMVVAAFLLGNPLSSSSASAVRWGVPKVNLKFEPEPV